MGTWGGGGFENDVAADFAAGVKSPADISEVFAAIPSDSTALLDADDAQRIIAAAECIAALMGRPSPDLPDGLEKRLKTFAAPDHRLINTSREAVSRVLRHSELLELWEEEDSKPFNRAITGLIDRLNPEVKPKKRPRKRKAAARQICAFCNGEIALEELYSFTIAHVVDAEDMGSAIRRGAWCHLACLNERLHPRHLVQEWRFDPEEIEREARKLLDLE